MIKAVIFDLDGTLLNTLQDLANAVNFALKSCKYPQRTLEEVRNFVGNGVKILMKRAVPEGTSEEDYARCLEIFSKYYLEHMYDFTAAYPGILQLLQKLNDKGVKIAVVSNKLHEAVEELCHDYFGALIQKCYGVSQENQRKPSPVNVLSALDDLTVKKEDCVYVGDSNVDFETAQAANLRCIGVSWGFRSREELLALNFACVVDDAEELFEKIMML